MCTLKSPQVPVRSMLLKKVPREIPVRESCPGSPRAVRSADQSPAKCWRFGPSRRHVRPLARLQDCFLSSQSPRRAGALDRSCDSELFRLLLVPHILPFFRLAAIIFFFCKIFCKQPQKKKAIIKKGKERWHYDQETIAISHPSRHLATCC